MTRPILFALLALAAPLRADDLPLAKASAELAAAADAFVRSLDDGARKQACFPFESDERDNWAFVPKARNGLPYKAMTDEQRALARKILETAMSKEGLAKADAVITLEGILAELEKNPNQRDPQKYFTSIFGEPKATGTWAWRFEGHHLSINLTFVDGKAIAVTPSFLGNNPAEVRDGEHKGFRPMAAEEDLARALATTLNEAGKPVVYTAAAPTEILTGAERKVTQLEPVGVTTADLSEAQQAALLEVIATHARRFRAEIADQEIAAVRKDLANVRFGWAGSLKPGEAYYYRIQGSGFLLEVVNSQNHANHIHATWRKFGSDFGRDALAEHYQQEKH